MSTVTTSSPVLDGSGTGTLSVVSHERALNHNASDLRSTLVRANPARRPAARTGQRECRPERQRSSPTAISALAAPQPHTPPEQHAPAHASLPGPRTQTSTESLSRPPQCLSTQHVSRHDRLTHVGRDEDHSKSAVTGAPPLVVNLSEVGLHDPGTGTCRVGGGT